MGSAHWIRFCFINYVDLELIIIHLDIKIAKIIKKKHYCGDCIIL